jgi:hypothetical protein
MKLFVYGSLMARRELERVLGRVYSQPLVPFVLSGYRRDWSASENGVAYLNLTAVPESSTTGFIAEIDPGDLPRLDAWESTYKRVRVGNVQTYVCRTEFRNQGKVVSRTYWLLVQAALSEPLPELPGHLTMTDEA